jgi:hypothetical protein
MISAKTSVGEDVESSGMIYELLATIKYWLAWDEFWGTGWKRGCRNDGVPLRIA